MQIPIPAQCVERSWTTWCAAFSDAYLNAGQLMMTRSGSSIKRPEDFVGKRVGAGTGTEGDTILRDLARSMPRINVHVEYETSAEALAALARGELDVVIADAVAALSAQFQYPHLEVAQALSFDPYVLAVPAEAYQLAAEVNQALSEMRDDGYFDRANRKWFRPQ